MPTMPSETSTSLKRTPFHEFHVSAGAKLVEFAGWEMPILYKSITEEHHQCRTSGALFDVSHMGRLMFKGPDALKLLDAALTRKLVDMKVGQCRYSLMCHDTGGVLDDVIVSRDVKNWSMVCNASNRDRVHRQLIELRKRQDLDCDLVDQTEATAMVAIQGPKVMEKLGAILPIDLAGLKRYHFETTSLMLFSLTVFRSGYTGEDGVEIVLPAKPAGMAIRLLTGSLNKERATIAPAGLGARDTLRTEAGMPLYGHELADDIDPISAGLGWAVDLSKQFVGVEKLREIAATGPRRRLVGLELSEKRIARQGTPILKDGSVIGVATSGTLSPTLGKSIAMAYLDSSHAGEGTEVTADLRGSHVAARVVKLPFYKRPV
jgi:aminomethyltransferase